MHCLLRLSLPAALLLAGFAVSAQVEKPFIKLVEPTKLQNKVTVAKQFIVGSTCKTCTLSINGQPVKVYPTGAFAIELKLPQGDTTYLLEAAASGAKPISKEVNYQYSPPKPPTPVTSVEIASVQTFPEGNLVLQPGDKIQFRVKALPGATVTTINHTMLYEQPVPATKGMPGIYQGTYTVQPTDSFASVKFPVSLVTADGQTASSSTANSFSVLSPLSADIALTKGRLAFLEYGLGDDRLGGAKMGYLDSLVPLKIIGKVGTDYKVQLSRDRTAYINDELVTLMPKGSFNPSALTGNINVSGDDHFDFVSVNLGSRLPYQSVQWTDPSRIVVDIFGATSNTNWITQLQTAKEIAKVDYEQIADDIFRLIIQLKHAQHWGHAIYYQGNSLVIRVKQQPRSLALKDLVIGVDAGHGGSNTGGGGPTGSSEKVLALAVSLKLQQALQKEGAKVIMSRTREQFFDNKERILFYRDSLPDLLVSVHLNSSSDPIHAGGTSTHYKHIGFKPLSYFIYQHMLGLGLKEYGNIGEFNFMLNSPTEYPNALVETLFLSNPAEEMLILDEGFQQKIADAIVAGIKDFLQAAGR